MKMASVLCSAVIASSLSATAAVVPDVADLAINKGCRVAYEHPLPRMSCGYVKCGRYNNPEFSVPGVLTVLDSRLGDFLWKMRVNLMANRRMLFVDGRVIVCNHNWIRDHVHAMKGWCHWERDLCSFLQFVIDTQRADGQFFELVKQLDDRHWSMVDPDCRRIFPEDNQSLVRLELEADVEYLVVEGAHTYYRNTGDDDWLRRNLPSLEKGIDYQTSSPKRWSERYGLVTRPYTIDTWDFTYEKSSALDRRVKGPMCAMHGDNTGVYQAMGQLAWMNERIGRKERAQRWRGRAEDLKFNVMKHLWNGRFFVHQFPVDGSRPYDTNEVCRLSLSDAYALSRGILSIDQNRSVIEEFQSRRKSTRAFAEWFTIDPPYKDFQGYKPGEYLNGAISPFTAGELAKGAFQNGYEEYGWDIVRRVMEMVERDGDLYFLYSPCDRAAQNDSGPSAWGAAAMISAVDEGLAGIVNAGVCYDELCFSPRWPVTPYREGRYITGCESAGRFIDVRWILAESGMRYNLRCPARCIKAHLLLPRGKVPGALLVNGKETPYVLTDVFGSKYVDVEVYQQVGEIDFEVMY